MAIQLKNGFCKKCSNVKNAVHQMKKLDCFVFQVANFNSSLSLSFSLSLALFLSLSLSLSLLLLESQKSVLINLMSFPSQKFKSTVSDECPLYSLSLSEVDQSSPMPLCNEDCGGFSLVC